MADEAFKKLGKTETGRLALTKERLALLIEDVWIRAYDAGVYDAHMVDRGIRGA